jgi:hypothetical protein
VKIKKTLRGWLCRLLGCTGKPAKKEVRFNFVVGLAVNKRKVIPMLELTITNEQKIPVTLAPTTAAGKPAELDGPAKFSVISGSSTVVAGEDGKSAELISSDTPGDTVFLVEADADLGEGVETISDTITLHVAGARAANLGLTAGTAVPK